MATKEIYIADASETQYYLLPGSTGSFSVESESAEDTIFGQSYSSMERTLFTWTADANAVVKGYGGYTTTLKKQGTSTSVTGEAFSQDSGQIYSIDDATKQIWDRSATITFYDGTTDINAEVEWIDPLFGRVKFLDTYTISGAVTADLSYFPTSALGKANSVDLTMSTDPIDNSDFATVQGNGGYRTFEPGLRTYSISLSGIYDASIDLLDELENRNELIVEVDLGGNGNDVIRCYVKMASDGLSGDVGALEEESAEFEATVPYAASDGVDNVNSPFSWNFGSSSTLSSAITTALNAFQNQSYVHVKYLHDPSAASGSQGWSGKAVLSDSSLSFSLDGMNELSFSFNGTDAYTDE